MEPYLPDIDLPRVLANLSYIGVAYLLALPIAWDRATQARSAGLRTFPLVAVASCGFTLIGAQIAEGDAASLSRIVQGLMTGIGFIGGGAILKTGDAVRGTATAASIWTTGAIGAATALGRIEIALVLSIATFLTLRAMAPLKSRLKDGEEPCGS